MFYIVIILATLSLNATDALVTSGALNQNPHISSAQNEPPQVALRPITALPSAIEVLLASTKAIENTNPALYLFQFFFKTINACSNVCPHTVFQCTQSAKKMSPSLLLAITDQVTAINIQPLVEFCIYVGDVNHSKSFLANLNFILPTFSKHHIQNSPDECLEFFRSCCKLAYLQAHAPSEPVPHWVHQEQENSRTPCLTNAIAHYAKCGALSCADLQTVTTSNIYPSSTLMSAIVQLTSDHFDTKAALTIEYTLALRVHSLFIRAQEHQSRHPTRCSAPFLTRALEHLYQDTLQDTISTIECIQKDPSHFCGFIAQFTNKYKKFRLFEDADDLTVLHDMWIQTGAHATANSLPPKALLELTVLHHNIEPLDWTLCKNVSSFLSQKFSNTDSSEQSLINFCYAYKISYILQIMQAHTKILSTSLTPQNIEETLNFLSQDAQTPLHIIERIYPCIQYVLGLPQIQFFTNFTATPASIPKINHTNKGSCINKKQYLITETKGPPALIAPVSEKMFSFFLQSIISKPHNYIPLLTMLAHTHLTCLAPHFQHQDLLYFLLKNIQTPHIQNVLITAGEFVLLHFGSQPSLSLSTLKDVRTLTQKMQTTSDVERTRLCIKLGYLLQVNNSPLQALSLLPDTCKLESLLTCVTQKFIQNRASVPEICKLSTQTLDLLGCLQKVKLDYIEENLSLSENNTHSAPLSKQQEKNHFPQSDLQSLHELLSALTLLEQSSQNTLPDLSHNTQNLILGIRALIKESSDTNFTPSVDPALEEIRTTPTNERQKFIASVKYAAQKFRIFADIIEQKDSSGKTIASAARQFAHMAEERAQALQKTTAETQSLEAPSPATSVPHIPEQESSVDIIEIDITPPPATTNDAITSSGPLAESSSPITYVKIMQLSEEGMEGVEDVSNSSFVTPEQPAQTEQPAHSNTPEANTEGIEFFEDVSNSSFDSYFYASPQRHTTNPKNLEPDNIDPFVSNLDLDQFFSSNNLSTANSNVFLSDEDFNKLSETTALEIDLPYDLTDNHSGMSSSPLYSPAFDPTQDPNALHTPQPQQIHDDFNGVWEPYTSFNAGPALWPEGTLGTTSPCPITTFSQTLSQSNEEAPLISAHTNPISEANSGDPHTSSNLLPPTPYALTFTDQLQGALSTSETARTLAQRIDVVAAEQTDPAVESHLRFLSSMLQASITNVTDAQRLLDQPLNTKDPEEELMTASDSEWASLFTSTKHLNDMPDCANWDEW